MASFNAVWFKYFRSRAESGARRTALNAANTRGWHRLGLLFLMLPVSVFAIAQSLRFDIPAQPLPMALKAFADQARIQLLYRHDAVQGASGKAVVGDFDTREALQMLLKGTGLEVVYSKNNAATIWPMQTASKPIAAVPRANDNTRLAQAKPASSSPSARGEITEEVIVEGTRPEIERRAHTFVTGVTHRGYAVESLARWNKPICPLVAGIPSDQGEFILQRISQAVRAAGADLAPRKCRPNFHVVLTPEPDQLLDLWRKRAPRLFGGEAPAIVRRVMSKPRPIRVWYNAWEMCTEGGPGADTGFGLKNPVGVDCRLQDSRLVWSAVNGISSVIVLVDLDDIKEVELGPLTDYIAMVGLAEVNLDGDWGDEPTVLRLFADSGDAASQRMSAWDRAFLKALYNTSQNSRFQRSSIAQTMVRDFLGR